MELGLARDTHFEGECIIELALHADLSLKTILRFLSSSRKIRGSAAKTSERL
jgi:hypothetical protein